MKTFLAGLLNEKRSPSGLDSKLIILNGPVTTFFNCLNLNFVFKVRIKMWNLNFEIEFIKFKFLT